MATRSATDVLLDDKVRVITWEGITEADDGAAVQVARYPDKSVQVVGDFTSSGAITIEGSNDGTNWGTLHDHVGAELVITDDTPKLIAENTLYIRPRASAGSSVDMDVIIVGAPR
jgi:hypothetical protein